MIKLYYWSKEGSKKQNFGDLLSKFIVENISNKKVRLIDPSRRWFRKIFRHYFAIGSILCRANENSIVWGSGIIKKNENIKKAKFVAIRGPKTRKRLLELGYIVPKIYGDPGLLVNLFYKPTNVVKKYTIGIIPHYVDYNEIKDNYKNNKDVLVINLMCNSVEKIIDKMLSCEKIISTSLHGVIVSHSYKIPALWLKYGEKLAGDDIKFYDYYESVGINWPLTKYFHYKSLDALEEIFIENKAIERPSLIKLQNVQKGLINSCPFISKRKKNKILLNESWE
jgi:hypothetical protein